MCEQNTNYINKCENQQEGCRFIFDQGNMRSIELLFIKEKIELHIYHVLFIMRSIELLL